MKTRKGLRIVAAAALLGAMAWMFVVVIWIPLYSQQKTAEFHGEQEAPALEAEIIRGEGSASRSWTLKDKQALSKLRAGLQSADYAGGAKEPSLDQKFRLRIRRSDSRVDEYEVLLDERGREHDMLYVVRRSGGGSVYGSAFKTPELRSAIQQILQEPPAALK